MITKQKFLSVYKGKFAEPCWDQLEILMPRFAIDDKWEICHCLSQFGHESDQFRTMTEYASGNAYEGRKDLGNIYAGDGVKFKGRGPIQTTGRANYIKVGKEILDMKLYLPNDRKFFEDNAITKVPHILENPYYGVLSSLLYWNRNEINKFCKPDGTIVQKRLWSKQNGWYTKEMEPIEAVTRTINGGINGLEDRKAKYKKMVQLWDQAD